MKRHIITLLVCSFIGNYLQAANRNVVMALDFDRESLREEFKSNTYKFTSNEFGPVTAVLLTALQQQSAPIIVSSCTWRNAIERGKAFQTAIKGGDASFLTRYSLFKNQNNIKAFINDLRANYDPSRDLMLATKSLVPAQYYQAYQTFYSSNPVFKPKEWIIKKVSDYIYLFIPLKYVQQLEQRKDTPDIARKTTTPLSPRERILGIKYGKLSELSANTLLDVNAHQDVMNISLYKNLVPMHSHRLVERLLQYKWQSALSGFMFGQHVVNVLPSIFVTHSDLKMPGGNRDETDINESYFLHEWLVYLVGHGSLSQGGQLEPIVQDLGGGAVQSAIAYTAGIDQGAFRDLLAFFNNRVDTGALVYTSCYSGGHHLFKLFEHKWDYPKRQGVGKKAKVTRENIVRPDIFNFLIIATNMFYSVTSTSTFMYWTDGNHYERLARPSMDSTNFFNQLSKFLHNQPVIKAPKQVKGKKNIPQAHPGVEQQLANILSNVTNFNIDKNYQVPAIRFPYTEWFVPLSDAGQEIVLSTQQELDAELKEEMRIRVMLEALAKKKALPIKVQQSIDAYAKLHGLKTPPPVQPNTASVPQPAQPSKPPVQPLKPTQPNVQQGKPPVQRLPVKPQPVKEQPVMPQPTPPQPVNPQQQPPAAQSSLLIQAIRRLESSLYGVITQLLK